MKQMDGEIKQNVLGRCPKGKVQRHQRGDLWSFQAFHVCKSPLVETLLKSKFHILHKKSGTTDGDGGEGDLSDRLADGLQGGYHGLFLPHGVGLGDKVDGKGGAEDADEQPEEFCQNWQLGVCHIIDLDQRQVHIPRCTQK